MAKKKRRFLFFFLRSVKFEGREEGETK